jgi:alkylation response protein AidB-like acyl-CoA dehydrogenase
VDFSLSEQQSTLRDSVHRYCHEHYDLQSRQQTLRSTQGYSKRHWAAFAGLGWLGAGLPEAAGGYGGSMIETAIILEEFGRALVIEPYLPAAILAAQTIWLAGGREWQRALLQPMIEGQLLLALAHTEPGGNGVDTAVATAARALPGGGFALNGKKSMVLGGNRAHRLIVSARTSGEANDRSGVSLFVVDDTSPGLVRRNYRTLDGSGAADLVFNEVAIRADCLMGPEGEGLGPIERAVDFAIVGLCAEAVGSMDQVITTSAEYLKTRRAYNTTLSTFQALQHQLADMLVELEMSRSILHRALAAFSIEGTLQRQQAASAAKALVGRAGKLVCARGVQLHGGMGMVNDYLIGQQFKRLTVIEALFGDSDFHLNRRYRPETSAP